MFSAEEGHDRSAAKSGSVPVWIDDRKQLEGFLMTRCIYQSLAMDASEGGDPLWLEQLGAARDPDLLNLDLLVLSLEAVVTRPMSGPLFESGEDFRGLYDLFEERSGWHLDFGFIWLPNRIVEPALERFERDETDKGLAGRVLRVDARLFLEALAATVAERVPGGTPWVDKALSSAEAALDLVRPSPVETLALQEFSASEIDSAIEELRAREERPELELLLWRDSELGLMRGKRPLGGDYDA